MNTFAKMVRVLGYVLLYLAIAVIGFGLITTWWFNGFGALMEVLNPFNVVNFIVTAVTLAPGILLIWASDKIKERSNIMGSDL
ncbi:MAG: hypothetical protein JKX71_06790 [Amylibacter sp.]|nr:hypothetical protein [Amylibacter sp.]